MFTLVLWIRDPNKVEGVPLVVKLFGSRPSVAALSAFSGMLGERDAPTSSGGADNGRVCGRLDLMYADTTVRSTVLLGFTLFPVSTSVSSAPIRASKLRRKGGMREELLLREWLL